MEVQIKLDNVNMQYECYECVERAEEKCGQKLSDANGSEKVPTLVPFPAPASPVYPPQPIRTDLPMPMLHYFRLSRNNMVSIDGFKQVASKITLDFKKGVGNIKIVEKNRKRNNNKI